jgi:delta1-piperideine-2-carboxylate reductase
MGETRLTLEEVHALALDCLSKNGCDEANAAAVADTILAAERDLCHAHGLFRLPGYIASLRSGKVNGRADPRIEGLAPAVLRCDGDNGYAPLALRRCRDPLAALAADQGIAALALVRTHHFAALWIEVEALAELGLAAFAFTAYMPAVAPAGGKKPFFGTNPMAFGPPGVGIDAAGNPTNDPQEVLEGAMLPFGGHKGASLALMIELLVGPLIGERCSFEAAEADPKDGGPPRGGELLLAIDPARFGDAEGWRDHTERLFERLLSQEGTRLPGGRRHANRSRTQENGIAIPQALYEKILSLSDI